MSHHGRQPSSTDLFQEEPVCSSQAFFSLSLCNNNNTYNYNILSALGSRTTPSSSLDVRLSLSLNAKKVSDPISWLNSSFALRTSADDAPMLENMWSICVTSSRHTNKPRRLPTKPLAKAQSTVSVAVAVVGLVYDGVPGCSECCPPLTITLFFFFSRL